MTPFYIEPVCAAKAVKTGSVFLLRILLFKKNFCGTRPGQTPPYSLDSFALKTARTASMTNAEKVHPVPRIACSTSSIKSFGKRIDLLVLGDISGIWNPLMTTLLRLLLADDHTADFIFLISPSRRVKGFLFLLPHFNRFLSSVYHSSAFHVSDGSLNHIFIFQPLSCHLYEILIHILLFFVNCSKLKGLLAVSFCRMSGVSRKLLT